MQTRYNHEAPTNARDKRLENSQVRRTRLLRSLAHIRQLRKKEAIELCQKFGIGISTAYRHLKRGTTPCADRREGRDGKTYPAPAPDKPSKSKTYEHLVHARQALNRADNEACTNGFLPEDLSVVRDILTLAQDMVVRWQEVTK